MSDAEPILRVLDALATWDHCDEVFWRTDGKYAPVTFFVKCNDLFAWGCADCEPLSAETVDAFNAACHDAHVADAPGEHLECWGPLLYCARRRGMRPQGPYYKRLPVKLHALFNACGPERTT